MTAEDDRPGARPDTANSRDRDDRLRELGTVTGELLHDLGGVLSVLSARVALAMEEARLGRIPEEELKRVQRDADELGRMVREILDEVRGAPRSPEMTFPLLGTVEAEVERWLARAPSVEVVLESSVPEGSEIGGPRSFFSRAFGNLLRNAARFAKSQVRVSVRPLRESGMAEIRVEDDGEGIDEEIRARMLRPFESDEADPTERSGMGLGLSFAGWGIERLGGRLIPERDRSVLGGACFRVTLPLWSGAGPALPGNSTSSGPHRPSPTAGFAASREAKRSYGESDRGLENQRIAVVEDDEGIRRVFARLLRRSGAEVVEMDPARWSSVRTAVDELDTYRPHVILVDLNLEVMSGLDLYAHLRATVPDLADRVLFLTGGAPPVEPLDRPLVNKMIVWDELVASVRRVARPGF